MSNTDLYIIVPYFNFINYKSGIANLNVFLQHISLYKNVKVVLVEGYNNKKTQLNNYSQKVYKHLKFHVPHILWVKENLINLGFKSLPTDWKYAGWIDRDIIFCNPGWAQSTVKALNVHDIIQPWKECIFLDKNYNHEHIDFGEWSIEDTYLADSFCSKRFNDLAGFKKNNRFSHPGQAWCISRNFYDKTNGLYDKCILGGGDGVLMYSLLGEKTLSPVMKTHENEAFNHYKNILKCSVGYVSGVILHHYHGNLAKRKYLSKAEIYQHHKFDPQLHLTYSKQGILMYTQKAHLLALDVKRYFLERDEDS